MPKQVRLRLPHRPASRWCIHSLIRYNWLLPTLMRKKTKSSRHQSSFIRPKSIIRIGFLWLRLSSWIGPLTGLTRGYQTALTFDFFAQFIDWHNQLRNTTDLWPGKWIWQSSIHYRHTIVILLEGCPWLTEEQAVHKSLLWFMDRISIHARFWCFRQNLAEKLSFCVYDSSRIPKNDRLIPTIEGMEKSSIR